MNNNKYSDVIFSNIVSIEVPARKNSARVALQGIFVGARVSRGPDWDWGNQDGGLGEIGAFLFLLIPLFLLLYFFLLLQYICVKNHANRLNYYYRTAGWTRLVGAFETFF